MSVCCTVASVPLLLQPCEPPQGQSTQPTWHAESHHTPQGHMLLVVRLVCLFQAVYHTSVQKETLQLRSVLMSYRCSKPEGDASPTPPAR